jgi:hypothetical protein
VGSQTYSQLGTAGSWVPQVVSTGDTCPLGFGDQMTCGV